MSRSAKKRKRDPYSTNLERLSVYPSYRRSVSKAREAEREQGLREGSIIRVRISGIDDEGKPTGFYKGYEVSIEVRGREPEPGESVTVRVKRISGRKVSGELAEGGETD